MENAERIAVLEAELNDLRGRMIATQYVLAMLIKRHLHWPTLDQHWESDVAKLVDTMTAGALSPHEQREMLDHLGRLSTARNEAQTGEASPE